MTPRQLEAILGAPKARRFYGSTNEAVAAYRAMKEAKIPCST